MDDLRRQYQLRPTRHSLFRRRSALQAAKQQVRPSCRDTRLHLCQRDLLQDRVRMLRETTRRHCPA